MTNLTTHQKRALIEDVYSGFIAAAIDQQKTLGQIVVTDPKNTEAKFAFGVADRLLGYLQVKNAKEFKAVPPEPEPVKIRITTDGRGRNKIRIGGGGSEVPGPETDGASGGDNGPSAPGAVSDDP